MYGNSFSRSPPEISLAVLGGKIFVRRFNKNGSVTAARVFLGSRVADKRFSRVGNSVFAFCQVVVRNVKLVGVNSEVVQHHCKRRNLAACGQLGKLTDNFKIGSAGAAVVAAAVLSIAAEAAGDVAGAVSADSAVAEFGLLRVV